jgi:hypothetical protein
MVTGWPLGGAQLVTSGSLLGAAELRVDELDDALSTLQTLCVQVGRSVVDWGKECRFRFGRRVMVSALFFVIHIGAVFEIAAPFRYFFLKKISCDEWANVATRA